MMMWKVLILVLSFFCLCDAKKKLVYEYFESSSTIPRYYFSSVTNMVEDCYDAEFLNIYVNLRTNRYPAALKRIFVDLTVRSGTNPSDAFIDADVVHINPSAFRRTDSYYKRDEYPEFFVDATDSYSISPKGDNEPYEWSIENPSSGLWEFNFAIDDDEEEFTSFPLILDSYTYLKLSIPHCGLTAMFSGYGANDTFFTMGTDEYINKITSLLLRGVTIFGTYELEVYDDEDITRDMFIGYPDFLDDPSIFPLSDYLDDTCQCGLGVPDRACQDPKIGPFNCKGYEDEPDCVNSEMCVLDTIYPSYLDYKDINCQNHLKNYGTDYVCDCGCITDYDVPDLDCYFPGRYRTVVVDTKETYSFKGKCNGVTAVCNEIKPTCSGEKWKCSLDQYNDGTRCDCHCGVYDPDCDDLNLPTSCADDFACILNKSDDLTSMYCSAPKKWSCEPSAYKDGVTCDCNCTVLDPDCLNANTSAISGCGSFSQKAWTCNSESKCIPAACGNNIIDPFLSEECDGGSGCSTKCKCTSGYEPRNPRASSCASICGDGIVTPDEECDSNKFCDSTCHCTPDHPYNSIYAICSGCGNDIVEEGEECDGGEGCLDICMCDKNNHYVAKNPASVDCRKESNKGVVIGASVAASVAGLLAVAAIIFFIAKFKRDKSRASDRINESDTAVQMTKMRKTRVDFEGTSTNTQNTSTVNMLATLDISQEGGGMTLDVDELERTQSNLSSTQLAGPTGVDASAGAGMALDDDDD